MNQTLSASVVAPEELWQRAVIQRQRGILAEGAIFIGQAARVLAEGPGFSALSEETRSFLRLEGDIRRARLVFDAVAEAMRQAATHSDPDSENLSLCVFVSALLADELEAAGMDLDIARLNEALPQLNIEWCRAQYRMKCLRAMRPAGSA
jgi:hypothetical protein